MCCLVFDREWFARLLPEEIAGGLIKNAGNTVRRQDRSDTFGVGKRVRCGSRVKDFMEHAGRYDRELGSRISMEAEAGRSRR